MNLNMAQPCTVFNFEYFMVRILGACVFFWGGVEIIVRSSLQYTACMIQILKS
jgi:hypothetical protein